MNKNIKKVLVTTLCVGGLFSLAGCDLTNLFNNKERTVNDAVDAITDSAVVTKEGLFRSEKVFNVNGTNVSYVFTFDKEGGLEMKNLKDDSKENYTYKVIDNLIELKQDDVIKTYLDYCTNDNLIFWPKYNVNETTGKKTYTGGLTGVLEGVVASEKGTGTAGLHIEINLEKGSLPAKLTAEKNSAGYCYRIKKNGTFDDKPYKYIASDAIPSSEFDTSEVGTHLVNVTISSKTYKAEFRVYDKID